MLDKQPFFKKSDQNIHERDSDLPQCRYDLKLGPIKDENNKDINENNKNIKDENTKNKKEMISSKRANYRRDEYVYMFMPI